MTFQGEFGEAKGYTVPGTKPYYRVSDIAEDGTAYIQKLDGKQDSGLILIRVPDGDDRFHGEWVPKEKLGLTPKEALDIYLAEFKSNAAKCAKEHRNYESRKSRMKLALKKPFKVVY